MTARALVAACITVWLCLTDACARELRIADTHPADYPTVQALNHMGRLLAERSQGRLSLKVLHSRTMGEEAETIEHMRVGALDMARANLALLAALVPEAVVPSLPFVFRDAEHMHKVMDGPIGDSIAKGFERHGMIALAFYDSGARSFYSRRGPLRRLADFKGLRIRVQQSPISEAMVAALGAVPTPLPFGQVMVGLSTGVIDGAENNWPSYHDNNHHRSAPFYVQTAHTMTPEVVLISRKTWDEMEPADRAMLAQAARDSVPVMRELWHRREAEAMQAALREGVVVGSVDRAAFAAAMHPLYDRFAATPSLRALLHRIQAVP